MSEKVTFLIPADTSDQDFASWRFTAGAGPSVGLTIFPITSTGEEWVLYRIAGSRVYGVVFKVNALGKERVVYAFTGRSARSNPKGDFLSSGTVLQILP